MEQPSLDAQRQFWNDWIKTCRGDSIDAASERRRAEVLHYMKALALEDAKILEVGCANGWLCADLSRFGQVWGTDIADAPIREAQSRYPSMHFIAGDFVQLRFDSDFDVVVCVDTLASVADHVRFVRHMSDRLKPGGHLILTTQNPLVFSRYSRLSPLAPGQVRNWASRAQLRELLTRYFDVLDMKTVNPSIGDRGILGAINSRWVNFPARLVMSQRGVDRFKEALRLGQTIVALARKPWAT